MPLYLVSRPLPEVRGRPAVIGYALVVVAGVWLIWRMAHRLHDRLTERQALILAALALVALGLVFAIGYPLANSGRSARAAIAMRRLNRDLRLLSGQYPYHARTYLDNPISPMPGSLLLAAPFVALGRSAYRTWHGCSCSRRSPVCPGVGWTTATQP